MHAAALFALGASVALLCGSASAQVLPAPTPNIETIPAGSLVIPMDNDKQNIGAAFNLAAYGLVKELLDHNIPVKWAIRAGKTKTSAPTDGIDFSASAARVAPSAIAAAVRDFRGGPFIVTQSMAAAATAIISTYNAARVGDEVAVYSLTNAEMIDIRFTLTQRPYVTVLDDGGKAQIQVSTLLAAGFAQATCVGGSNPGANCDEASDCSGGGNCKGTDYEVITPPTTAAKLSGTTCSTIITEPHWDETDPSITNPVVSAVRTFALSGGNILAQCAGARTYEQNTTFGHFQTTQGTQEPAGNVPFLYPNADLPYSQFVDNLDNQAGSLAEYGLASGSVFQNSGHPQVMFTDTDGASCVGARRPASTAQAMATAGRVAPAPALRSPPTRRRWRSSRAGPIRAAWSFIWLVTTTAVTESRRSTAAACT